MAEKSVDVKDVLGGKASKKPQPPKKKKHKGHSVDHLDDGSYLMRLHHAPDEDGKTPDDSKFSARDLDGLHDLMEQHLGDPNVGEEKAGV